jgi:hypothetical protein
MPSELRGTSSEDAFLSSKPRLSVEDASNLEMHLKDLRTQDKLPQKPSKRCGLHSRGGLVDRLGGSKPVINRYGIVQFTSQNGWVLGSRVSR